MDSQSTLLGRLAGIKWIAFSAVAFFFAYLTFVELTKLESGDIQSIKTQQLFAVMYRTIGKWPMVALIGTWAAAMAAYGIYQVVMGKKPFIRSEPKDTAERESPGK